MAIKKELWERIVQHMEEHGHFVVECGTKEEAQRVKMALYNQVCGKGLDYSISKQGSKVELAGKKNSGLESLLETGFDGSLQEDKMQEQMEELAKAMKGLEEIEKGD